MQSSYRFASTTRRLAPLAFVRVGAVRYGAPMIDGTTVGGRAP